MRSNVPSPSMSHSYLAIGPSGSRRGRGVEADGLAGADRAPGHGLLPRDRDRGLRGVGVAAEADDRAEVLLARRLARCRRRSGGPAG